MSQRGPAPRPGSRRSSKSPPIATFSSPHSSQPGPQPGLVQRDDPAAQHHDRRESVVAEEGGRPYPANPRTSVVHNILNPSDQRHPYGSTITPVPRPPEGGGTSSPGIAPRPYGTHSPSHPYVFHSQQQQPPVAPQPTYSPFPPSTLPSGAPSILERGSPTGRHSYSPIEATRRILTPKSPRVSSLNRPGLVAGGSPKPPLPPHITSRGSLTSHDMGPRAGPSRLGAQTPLQGLRQGYSEQPPTTTPPPSRSLSQPIIGHALTSGHQHQHHQDHQQPTSRPPMLLSGSPFMSGLPPGRGLSAAGLGGDGRWMTSFLDQMAPGVGGARGTPMDGQHLLTITPSHGDEILVPVDIHQASKQADEKRQRNAGASARFRMRKKEREREQQQGLQKLETSNRELEKRARDMEAERDYYRNERNRLRDIVLRTPSISEWANRGPPSPTSARSEGFATEGMQMAGHHHHIHHPPPSSYPTSDPSMLERPARRRRTDSEPHSTAPTYGPPQPTTLPPIPPSAYGINPSVQHTSGPPGPARLPPLRLDQPPVSEHPPGSGAPPPPPLPPQTQGPYPPYGRPAYEPGWPAGPRGAHHDDSQR